MPEFGINSEEAKLGQYGGGGKENESIESTEVRTSLDEVDERLAERGTKCAESLYGEETVKEWTKPGFKEVDLGDTELEELALSLGEHRNHIRDEGRAAAEAGFDERACGLYLGVRETNKLLKRIKEVRGTDESLKLSQFDFVNLLGTLSYERIIDDHANWMNQLFRVNRDLVTSTPLLKSFRKDFNELENTHEEMQRKIRNA